MDIFLQVLEHLEQFWNSSVHSETARLGKGSCGISPIGCLSLCPDGYNCHISRGIGQLIMGTDPFFLAEQQNLAGLV